MDDQLNPLSSLMEFSAPKEHSSGRRELRAERNAMGFMIHAHPKSKEDAERAAATGEMIATLPIRRISPIYPQLSKKERAKLKRKQKGKGNA